MLPEEKEGKRGKLESSIPVDRDVPPVADDATATTAAAPSLGPKSQSPGGVQAGVWRQNSAPGMVVPKSSIFGYDDDDLAGTKHTIRLRRGSTPKAVRQPRKGGAGMFLE
jgi:hypothetical protein